MYETILVPTDGSEGARQALDRAVELATLFNAELHLLYVVDARQFSADKPEEAVEEFLADVEQEGRRVVDGLGRAASDAAVDEVVTAVRRGVAHEEIIGYAEDHGVELVVMGTHGDDGFERDRLGSVSTAVARGLEQPLLLI